MTKSEAVYNIIKRLPLLSDKVVVDLSSMLDSLTDSGFVFTKEDQELIDKSFEDFKNGNVLTLSQAMKDLRESLEANN